MLPTKFRFIWPSGFRGEDFFKSANEKQELPVVAIALVMDHNKMCTLKREPSKFQFIWLRVFRGED